MRFYRKHLIVTALSVSIAATVQAAERIGVGEKAKLQAAMQQYIERNLVNGSYLQLDIETGQVHALAPFKPHPVILQMGEYFVLCSDFRNDKGQTINVDFYVVRRGKSFVVFHSAADGDALLKRLMKQGRAKRVD